MRMLSTTERFGNSATFWKVRPMPTSQIRCAGFVRMLSAFDQDVALARLIKPAEAVEERGLAGAVGADQAENICPRACRTTRCSRAMMPPNTTLTSRTASRGLALRELCLRHRVPPDRDPGANGRTNIAAGMVKAT